MTKKLLVVITHSIDAPERAAAALSIVNAARSSGIDVAVFVINEGILLVKQGFAATITDQKAFPPIKDLLDSLVEGGQRFYACSTCAKQFGVDAGELLKGAELSGVQTLLELVSDREAMTF